MATTSYGVNDALAVKVWAKKLFVDMLKETYVDRFMGKSASSLIQVRDELSKSAGDQITVGLRMQLSGDGVQGDSTAEGNEEALTTYSDAVLINQLRHAVRSAGKMSEQRVPFSVREEAKEGLKDWWAGRLDTWFFNQVCGYTVQSDTRYTGNQAAIAVSSTRVIRQGGATDDATLSSSTYAFDLTLIDKAVEAAKVASPLIRTLNVDGERKYVMFLHPYQVTNMRTTTSVGQWLDIQKAVVAGGGKNAIYNGSIGEYNGVVLHEATRVTQGVANAGTAVTTARRAVLCGAQAACFAYGGDGGQEVSWVEELFDYKNQLGVLGGMIAGMKKTRFNSVDFGTIVVSSYAVANT